NRRSPWHREAAGKLAGLAEAGGPWALPWPCVHEFLAVTTNARLFPDADTAAAAMEQVAIWMELPPLRLLGEMQGHWRELERIVSEGRMRGGAIHDARIAAICLEHGVSELWSADRDFTRVGRLRVRNPLMG
ncbi:MAG: type II toxin-antitoxin system VapC family toxin, partial [Terriglobales bacterium]